MDSSELVESLVAVVEDAARVEMRAFEERDLEAIRAELVPRVSTLVEAALARQSGAAPRVELLPELHLARGIRADYARFRREIAGQAPPDPGTVHARLVSGAAAIARMVGRDFYPELRVSDRAELRALQRRLGSWLGGEDGHDPQSGLRLWEDLHGFAVLLAQINRRSELVEQDRETVEEALASLAADPEAPEPLPADLLQRLQRLKGRSDRIDELLAAPAAPSRDAWEDPLDPGPERFGIQGLHFPI